MNGLYIDYRGNAINRAIRAQFKRANRGLPPVTKYVVKDDSLDYVICDESDLDTFYNGCEIVAAIDPDGDLV
jgi:hypothetical protein